MYLNIFLFLYYLEISSFLKDLWSSGYDITLTRWGSAVRIRPDPLLIFYLVACEQSQIAAENNCARIRENWEFSRHQEIQKEFVECERNRFCRNSRAVKGARLRTVCLVLRRFESCFLHFIFSFSCKCDKNIQILLQQNLITQS